MSLARRPARFASLTLLALLLSPFPQAARAADAPAFPAEAVGENTLYVIIADAARLNPTDLRKSLLPMFGPMQDEVSKHLEEPLGVAQAGYDSLMKAGLQSVAVLVDMKVDAQQTPDVFVYLTIKEGADPEALKQAIAGLLPAGAGDAIAYDRAGKYLVGHLKGLQLPAGGDAARAKEYAEALAAGGDGALVMASVPNEAWREFARKAFAEPGAEIPPPLVALVPEIVRLKWGVTSISLGDAPGLRYVLNAADEASAKKLEEGANAALDQVKQMLAAKAGEVQAEPEGKKMLTAANELLEQVRPKREGARVTLNVETKTLTAMYVILVPSLTRARETANRVKCGSNLSMIGKACLIHANDNNGKLPPDQGTMLLQDDLTIQVFICPSGETQIPADVLSGTPEAKATWINQHSDYIYLGAGKMIGKVGADTLIAYEKLDHHHNGMNMLWGDGHVEYKRTAEAEKVIAEQKAK